MRNVTITVEDEVLRWAKVWAARHDSSVSRLLGELLRDRMRAEEAYEVAMANYLAAEPEEIKTEGAYPSRAAVHGPA